MNQPMPSTDLPQALDRLDRAISHAESALADRNRSMVENENAKNSLVREALADLDGIIAALGGAKNG